MDNLVDAATKIMYSQKTMLKAFKWNNQWRENFSKFLRSDKSI